jgi:hypothetical protein
VHLDKLNRRTRILQIYFCLTDMISISSQFLQHVDNTLISLYIRKYCMGLSSALVNTSNVAVHISTSGENVRKKKAMKFPFSLDGRLAVNEYMEV